MNAPARTVDAAALSPLAPAAPESWPQFADDEVAAVTEVLRSGRVNQWTGTRVKALEALFCRHTGQPHAIALANGTLTLELALRAYGIGLGDEVIVAARSFMASASCVSFVGATPIFADVDADSQNMTAETIAPLIGPKTKAIIPVHLAGWPCDMPAIMALAGRHGLQVIEDCAQAVGATVDGRVIGSFGQVGSFSFCQDKIITTGGEGGLVVFRDRAAYQRAWSLKDHGKSFEKMHGPPSGIGFRYVHDGIGTNWRLTEMQAAIGIVQMGKLPRWLELRARNAGIWRKALARVPCLRLPEPKPPTTHANYKLYAFLMPDHMKAGATRDAVLAALLGAGLRAFSGSCPEIYREAAYAHLNHRTLPVSHALGETSLMFEVHPTLDPEKLAATAERAAGIIAGFAA